VTRLVTQSVPSLIRPPGGCLFRIGRDSPTRRPASRSARDDAYWHFALHALAVIAFFAHVSTADASFFGFAAEAGVAESRHAAAPDEQLWMPSRIAWQSVFFPQAASGFAQALSMHLPQSVLPNDGDGAGAAAVASELGLALDVSAAAADADSAGAAESEAAGASELADAELSPAAVSGGLVSPPPHASQARGATATRATVTTERE
jgi:hypothetical protein